MTEKPFISREAKAKNSIRRELGIPKSVFAAIWRQARGSELSLHHEDEFDRDGVVAEAKEAVEQRWKYYQELLEAEGRGETIRKKPFADAIIGGVEGGDRNVGPMVRVGASTRLQAEAFSLLLAGLAEERKEVASYRRDRLGGRLVRREEAQNYLAELEETEAEEEETEAEGELQDAAIELGRLYAWSLEQAVLFVICGEVPKIEPLRVRRTREGGAVMPTRIEAMPWVPAKDITASYRLAQRVAQGKTRHGPAKEPHPSAQAAGARNEPSQARGERRGERTGDDGDEGAERVRRRRGSPDPRARAKPASDRSLEVYCFVERRRAEHATGGQATFEELRKDYDGWVDNWNKENPDEKPKKPFGGETESFKRAHARGKAWLMVWLDRPLLLDPP